MCVMQFKQKQIIRESVQLLMFTARETIKENIADRSTCWLRCNHSITMGFKTMDRHILYDTLLCRTWDVHSNMVEAIYYTFLHFTLTCRTNYHVGEEQVSTQPQN